MGADEYDAYLQRRAKEERVSATIVTTTTRVTQARAATVEKDKSIEIAEQAILRGIRTIDVLNVAPLSNEVMGRNEESAFQLLASADRYDTSDFSRASELRQHAVPLFKKNIVSDAMTTLQTMIAGGMNPGDARYTIAENLRRDSEFDNVPARSQARHRVAYEINKGNGRGSETIHALNQLVLRHADGTLDEAQTGLLRKMVRCFKAAYIHGDLSQDLIWKFELDAYRSVLPDLYRSFKQKGPMRKTAENTAGAAEVFEPTQTGEEKGFRATGKRRPFRDTSGGSGEKY